MQHTVLLTMLGIMSVLTVAVMILPLAKRLNIPYTVMLAAIGIVIGLLAHLAPENLSLGLLSEMLHALDQMEITSEVVFFVFLPALVFESALAIDVRRLFDDLAPILMLAIIGLLISTMVAGLAIHGVSGQSLLVCLLLGAIVSATDPVAVVAIFKDLGAPKRLAILVEGESLFNDATAIVAFTILSSMILGESDPSVIGGIGSFLTVFVGGIVVGFVMARLVCWMLRWIGESVLARTTLTIGLAYLSFIIAEHHLHVSGVMAVVTAACVLGSRGRSIITRSSWHGMEHVWEQIGFVANSVIFILVGIAVPRIMSDLGAQQFGWMALLIGAAFVARFAIIFGLLPLLSAAGLAQRVGRGYQAVMFWGGLRGAVSLALALAVMENPAFPEGVREFIGVMVCGFVLFTLFVNATTVKLVMKLFGLDQLSPVDVAVRDRVLSRSFQELSDTVEQTARAQQFDPALVAEVVEPYHRRSDAIAEHANLTPLGEADQIRLGLKTLVARENDRYASFQEQALVANEISRQLLRHAADLLDATKSDNQAGYEAAYARHLEFGWQARWAARIQRQFGSQRWLSRLLADRYQWLQATTMALRELADQVPAAVGEVVSESVVAELTAIIERRLSVTILALESIEAAYPEYTQAVRKRWLHQWADRLEKAHFGRLRDNASIGGDVYRDLMNDQARNSVEHAINPRLDLGLDASRLVAQVPLFAELSSERQHSIVQRLKPRLMLPGEEIIRKGEKGDAMYFISSGAVKVLVEPDPVLLGSGQFFGEMALLSDQPRLVTVVAKSFCDLLVLTSVDFQSLMSQDDELREAVEKVARERRE